MNVNRQKKIEKYIVGIDHLETCSEIVDGSVFVTALVGLNPGVSCCLLPRSPSNFFFSMESALNV